jgi:hypothetical protein
MIPTFHYLRKSFSLWIVIGLLVSLGTVAVADLLFYFTEKYHPLDTVVPLTVPFEFTTGLFVLLIGLVLFIPDFKVALANGISRKTFLLANLLSAGTVAAAFSIFNLIVDKVHSLFWPITFTSEMFYPQIGWAGLFILQFALYFLLIMIGRLTALAYYRSNTLGRWAISLAPFVLLGCYLVANARSGGELRSAISAYQHTSMRMEQAPFTLLIYAAILTALLYLLFRRAPLKD